MSTQTAPAHPPRTPHPSPRQKRYGALTRLRAARQQELSQGLRLLLDSLPAEAADVCDEQEHCERHVERELNFALLTMRSETLRGIDLALDRFHRGQDADCCDCGGPIGAARLRALPFAARCRPCQEALEAAPRG